MSEETIDNANQNEKKEKPFFLKHLFDFIVYVDFVDLVRIKPEGRCKVDAGLAVSLRDLSDFIGFDQAREQGPDELFQFGLRRITEIIGIHAE